MLKFLFLILLSSIAQAQGQYPEEWFRAVPRDGAPAWEIQPQDAKPGEVILSKRNELGILSNFAPTPFTYRNESYASVEGFWQMMKYPDPLLAGDVRFTKPFVLTRAQVAQLTAFEAKDAGNIGSKYMKELKIDWVSFEGEAFTYCSLTKGPHYRIIREAMKEKLLQNAEVKRILLATGDLILRPDHFHESCQAPEWNYHELWMEIRAELQE